MRLNWLSTKAKSNYKKLILDFIPAFLGVLIALGLSNWNEQRKENDFVKKSIVSIYDDNKTNLKNVNIQIEHFEKHIDTISLYMDTSEVNILELIVKNKGLLIKPLNQSGWDILKNSQLVTKIDYELLSLLTQMNEYIRHQDLQLNNSANTLYNSFESNNSNDKRRLLILITDIQSISKRFKHQSEELDSILHIKYKKILTPEF